MKTKLFLLLAICLTAFNVNAQNPNVVSITGEAQGGWGNGFDQDMTSTDGENWTLTTFTCAAANSPAGTFNGGLKFRANNDWAINWGNEGFPSGTGTQGGNNIQSTAGNWSVTFNSTTGAYLFAAGIAIPDVKIVGSAVTPPTGLAMSIVSSTSFAVTTTLSVGNLQFNIDGTVQGGIGFPTGTADSATASTAVPTAGVYKIVLDLNTAEYTFTLVPLYDKIGLVGPGAGGWPGDPGVPAVDINELITSDGIDYKTKSVILTVGDVKFRQNNAWDVSWGGGSFPAGPTVAANNIAVTAAGNYKVKLNKNTGAYAFGFTKIALVGPSAGGWPGDPGVPAIDANALTTIDGENYTLDNIVLTGGNAKFRFEDAWEESTGGTTFPVAAAGTSGDIPTTAGTYSITLKRSTGAYNFGLPLTNENFIAKTFKVSPNPSSTNWEIVSGNNEITSVQIVNILGKVVYSYNETSTKIVVDASDLSNGIYFAKVSSAYATETIKLIKN